MDIQFIQMDKKLYYHPVLEKGHNLVQVINDLLLGCFEIRGNDFCLYISSYLAQLVASPARRYSRMLRALLPLMFDTIPANLMLAPTNIFWNRFSS